MSKPRKTAVPLPGSKAKPSPKGPLSQEFIDSSDDSANEASSAPKTIQQKSPLKIAVHRPKTNGVPKSTPKSAKKANDTPKPTTKTSAPLKKAVPKQVVREEQGAESSSSSEESAEEHGTDIQAARQRQEKDIRQKSASISSSDSSSDDSEEEEPAPQNPMTRPTQVQSHSVTFQPARPYVPPKDFHPVFTNRASSFPSNALFEDLEGKQVWHITAPADVPLKDIKELVMENALQGEAIISHKGSNYGFSTAEVDESGAREVMIPRQTGYKAVSKRISHTFKIRQVVNLPKLKSSQAAQNTGSEAAASITQSTIRAPRPQVKGLKMRFFPSGVEDQSPITVGSSDTEDDSPAARPAGLAVPNGIHLPSKPEKRKHEQANGDERLESPTKKHKKHRTPEEIRKREEKKAKKARKREKEAAKMKS